MYSGIVCKIKTRPHPNADKIQLGVACGHQVVIGLHVKDHDLGVFFPCDGQLSHEMCMNNNLYSKHPETGEPMGGFFSDKRRVRAQKFRGEKSEGFWIPISSLSWTGNIDHLKDGDEITMLHGHLVCEKYFTQATKIKGSSNQPKKKREDRAQTKMFAQHFDTKQYNYNYEKIPSDAVVYITEKLHGTSGRTGYVQVEYPVTGWRHKINNLFRRKIFSSKPVWKIVTGSRRVDYLPGQSEESATGFYAGSSFRFQISKSLEGLLKKGETLYYEIVGYTDTGSPIMGVHEIKDKELKKVFGDSMVYKYGCKPNEYEIYIYRITMTNEDGDAVDLSWPNVIQRCKEMGLKHVPHIEAVFRKDLDLEYVHDISDGHSILDPETLREGVCLRVEHPDLIQTFKNKGYNFKFMEGLIKDNDNYVDEEEVS